MRAGEVGRKAQASQMHLGLNKEACGLLMGYSGPGTYDVGATQPWVTSRRA